MADIYKNACYDGMGGVDIKYVSKWLGALRFFCKHQCVVIFFFSFLVPS